ncbi:MAG: serine hydrolase, partial [Oscillospiraceae bacterium]
MSALASAVSFVPPETVYSEAVYMVNLDITDENGYGTVVFKQNENKLMSPASLTKIMTALLVLEHFEGNEQALKSTYISAPSTAFDELYLQDASTADFRIGEEASYSDLLYGLMLQSACEAANIIAYNLGKDNSMADFVRQMNEKAEELGATNTHFTNPHGLYSESQRTSARDLAIITQYAINKYPILLEIASTQNYDLEATNKHSSTRTVVNTNYMMSPTNGGDLYYYPYVKGIKTGTLDEAGRCLITTAEKNGFTYLLVTLNAPLKDENGNKIFYNFIDHKTLYEWAFSTLSYEKILTNGEEVAEV